MDVCKLVGMFLQHLLWSVANCVRLGSRRLMYVFLALHCCRGHNLFEAVGFSQS